MLGIRRVLSALTAPFGPPPPVEPLRDWNLNPYLHPQEARDGAKGHLIDAQGRDWLDLNSAWGANILGYGYPRVAAVIQRQALRFAGLGLPYPEFRELAKLLCSIIPGADAVRYGKNGSDATAGAVRLARAITGRERVLHRGYHGFQDWWMASLACPGVPAALGALIETLPDLAPATVDAAFRRAPGPVACLILDPMAPPMPTAEAIREIVEIVHRNGALVIFDEVVSGFRVAPGGAQQLWGITPDLCCFGKCIANGLPLSVLAGRQEYMDRLPSTNYGMTFEGEALSIAAALATLGEIIEQDVCGALAGKGRRLKQELARAAAEFGIQAELAGPDARPHLQFAEQGGVAERELRWLTIQELARRRILTLGTFNLCFSHDEADLQTIAAAFGHSMKIVRQAVDRGSVAGLLDKRIHRSMQC